MLYKVIIKIILLCLKIEYKLFMVYVVYNYIILQNNLKLNFININVY